MDCRDRLEGKIEERFDLVKGSDPKAGTISVAAQS
jgi:hypothetical protein